MHGVRFLIGLSVISALLASVLSLVVMRYSTPDTEAPSKEQRIADYYATENAVMVSPHGLRKELDKGGGSFVLVDLRSAEEYAHEHIVSAVNVPAYKDRDTSAYDEKERIIGAFRELVLNNPGKDIIVYCYSGPCMTGRKVGLMLAESGIYVKHLGIGWNEWRYYETLWNHEHEWSSFHSEDYISRGEDPGIPQKRDLPSPCGEGGLGC